MKNNKRNLIEPIVYDYNKPLSKSMISYLDKLMKTTKHECEICLNDEVLTKELVRSCCSNVDCENKICNSCFNEYIASNLRNSYDGAVKVLKCMSCKDGYIDKDFYSKYFKDQPLEIKYYNNCKSLLTIFCPGCDSRKSMLREGIEKEFYDNIKKDNFTLFDGIDQITSKQIYQILDQITISIKKIYPSKEDYENLIKNVIEIFSPEGSDNPKLLDAIFKECDKKKNKNKNVASCATWLCEHFIPSLIRDPERRARFQLFYYNKYPSIFTPCCGSHICFKCKITSAHTGKSCEQFQAERHDTDELIVNCPK